MAVRAMWKGVVRFGDVKVPVKLYSAVEDRSVRFRLLHEADKVPVEQELVNPDTNEVVPYGQAKRAYVTDEADLLILDPEELDEIKPPASRDIQVVEFLPPEAIDHRWYLRPYYLGPDGSEHAYAALVEALQRQNKEGLARWTMRNKEYTGALRIHRGYLMLFTLRNDAQVVPADSLPTPKGPDLDQKELSMAKQLVEMLAGPFEWDAYSDDYRESVLDLIETKAKGGRIETTRVRKEARYEDLSEALQASLKGERIRA